MAILQQSMMTISGQRFISFWKLEMLYAFRVLAEIRGALGRIVAGDIHYSV